MKSFKQIQCFNTLIQLNNDRIATYAYAAHMLNQLPVALDANPFFAQLSRECLDNTRALESEVRGLGGYPAENTSVFGKALLTWMEIRTIFSPDPVRAILNCCERMDRAVIQGYRHVIRFTSVSDEMRQRLLDHTIALESSHALIETFRNLQRSCMIHQEP